MSDANVTDRSDRPTRMYVRSPLEQRIDAFLDVIADGFRPLFRAIADGLDAVRCLLRRMKRR